MYFGRSARIARACPRGFGFDVRAGTVIVNVTSCVACSGGCGSGVGGGSPPGPQPAHMMCALERRAVDTVCPPAIDAVSAKAIGISRCRKWTSGAHELCQHGHPYDLATQR